MQRKPNVQTTQAKDCNSMLEIWRTMPEVLDDRGFVIAPAHDECVIPSVPCVWTSHSGRPDYAVAYNTPGIHPDALFDGWVQWNSTTRNIRIGDEFIWGGERMRIVNLHISEVEMMQEYGIIDLNAKRVAGGDLDG